MKAKNPHISMDKLSGLFGKTRQGYYYKFNSAKIAELDSSLIISLVETERKFMPRLGTVKLYEIIKPVLISKGIKIGRDKVNLVLSNNGMLVKRRKRYAKTTNSNHNFRLYKDLLKNTLIIRPDQVWVSDITYITTSTGFAYLSLVTDAYTKKIVGYNLAKTLESHHTVKAMQKALYQRVSKEKLMHHSDRGIQYVSGNYIELLDKHNIEISMTETSSPYDNAVAERVNGILKSEFGLGENLGTFEQAIKMVDQAIYIYNNRRPHLSCGMLTPSNAHKADKVLIKMWKKYPYKIKNLEKI